MISIKERAKTINSVIKKFEAEKVLCCPYLSGVRWGVVLIDPTARERLLAGMLVNNMMNGGRPDGFVLLTIWTGG